MEGVGFFKNKKPPGGLESIQSISAIGYAIFRINTTCNLKDLKVFAPTTAQNDKEVDIFYEVQLSQMTTHMSTFYVEISMQKILIK